MKGVILCGKQTTDGDTAQVGAETAEHLGIPHLSNVVSVIDAHHQQHMAEIIAGTLGCVLFYDFARGRSVPAVHGAVFRSVLFHFL